MRSGKRTQDFHFIKTERDALYYAAEIPSVSWGPIKDRKLSFNLLVSEDYSISPKEQASWFKKLAEGEMFSKPYLVLISSRDDDSLAVSVGYDLMKKALERRRVQVTGSAGINQEETHDETVFMLTNVYEEAPSDRIQSVRDWCYRHKESFRILCASGDPIAIKKRLRLKFNALFYLDSIRREESSFV